MMEELLQLQQEEKRLAEIRRTVNFQFSSFLLGCRFHFVKLKKRRRKNNEDKNFEKNGMLLLIEGAFQLVLLDPSSLIDLIRKMKKCNELSLCLCKLLKIWK